MGLAHTFHLDEEEERSAAPPPEEGPGTSFAGGSGHTGELTGEVQRQSGLLSEIGSLGGQISGLQGQITGLEGQVADLSAPEPPAPAPAPGPVGDPAYPGGVAPHESEQPGAGWVRVGPASVSHTMDTKPIRKAVHK